MVSEDHYTLRKDDDGWCVVDIETDVPVSVRDKILICMEGDEAKDAVVLLNMVERLKNTSSDATRTEGSGPPHPFLLPVSWRR